MTIAEKVAHLKGLMEGLNCDDKVLNAIADILEDLAYDVEDVQDALAEVGEQVELIDEDLETLENDYYEYDDCCCDDDDCDCCEGDLYEVVCPICDEIINFDEETLEKYAGRIYYMDQAIVDILNSPLGEQVEPDVLEYPKDPKDPTSMEKPVPVGIDVSDRKDLQEAYYLDGTTIYVGTIRSTARPELSKQFIEYLLK